MSSVDVAEAISAVDFSGCAATVIGYGTMGRQYVKALQEIGVGQIRVCSRSEAPMAELQGVERITTIPGGYGRLVGTARPDELAIVATHTADLLAAAQHMAICGFKKILIEKPVSLMSQPIWQLVEGFEKQGVDGVCAFNRVAYPSFLEARCGTAQDGGITSCFYTFTEFVDRIGPGKFSDQELARWGIANSLHVMSMAHGLIGLPESWTSHRSGALAWHPSGSVFVGSGISEQSIPFAFHADWGSKSRWSVEVHSRQYSYRLCPLEQLFRKDSGTNEWKEVPITVFAPDLKAGVAEQVAAMLSIDVRRHLPLVSVEQAGRLIAYGEELFGYTLM